MNKKSISQLSKETTESLTNRLAQLSIEAHTISKILVDRNQSAEDNSSEDVPRGHSTPDIGSAVITRTGKETDTGDREKRTAVEIESEYDRHDRQGNILEIGHKVKVL